MSARWTKAQWIILLVAWMGWVFDVMDAALFNFAKIPMLTAMLGAEGYKSIGPAIEGRIQSVFLFGWALGGLVFGIVADRWGRTRTLVVTILLYSVFTGLTALCQSPEQVMVARFLTALGIGGEWAAGAALVAEAFRSGGRGPASAFLQSAAAFGPMLAALANYVLAGKSWQWLFLVGIIPAIICVLARLFVEEPPRTVAAPRSPLSELWADAELRRHAFVAMVIGTVGVAGAGTATYWIPNLVKAVSNGLAPQVIAQRTSLVTVLAHVGTLAGVMVVPLLCERFGRRTTIGLFFLLSPIAVVVAMAGGASYEKLMGLMPMITFFAVGVSAAFVLYFPELFPSRVRATGAGLAYNLGRVLSIPMPMFTAAVIGAFGGSIVSGLVLSGSIYLLGLAALPFAPETKGLELVEN